MEQLAQSLKIKRLFLLTTQTAQWFHERGFTPADAKSLPIKRQALYNYRRNAKVYIKELA
jgi:amino-acid N-acetyltransferase